MFSFTSRTSKWYFDNLTIDLLNLLMAFEIYVRLCYSRKFRLLRISRTVRIPVTLLYKTLTYLSMRNAEIAITIIVEILNQLKPRSKSLFIILISWMSFRWRQLKYLKLVYLWTNWVEILNVYSPQQSFKPIYWSLWSFILL